MDDKDVYSRLSGLLNDDLKPWGRLRGRGPLRVLRELTHGIVFTGSVPLSNAARLWAGDAGQLRHGVERLSEALADRGGDPREWAAGVLRRSAEEVQEDDLIPIDATKLAKPYARHMQYALRWRAEDGKRLLGQIWHLERFWTRSFLALERMLGCVVLAGGFRAWDHLEQVKPPFDASPRTTQNAPM